MGEKPNINIELKSHIENLFQESINIKTQIYPQLIFPIEKAISIIHQSISNGGKILVCGNGGSAADSQHLSSEFLNRFESERQPLPAIALTTDSSTITSISNDYEFNLVFAKQVCALAKPEDILIAISTSGNSINICEAIIQMQKNNGRVIALTGRDGGKISKILSTNDLIINVPTEKTARIQEMHILIIHSICDGIDRIFLNH